MRVFDHCRGCCCCCCVGAATLTVSCCCSCSEAQKSPLAGLSLRFEFGLVRSPGSKCHFAGRQRMYLFGKKAFAPSHRYFATDSWRINDGRRTQPLTRGACPSTNSGHLEGAFGATRAG